jgi:hypothetical protein
VHTSNLQNFVERDWEFWQKIVIKKSKNCKLGSQGERRSLSAHRLHRTADGWPAVARLWPQNSGGRPLVTALSYASPLFYPLPPFFSNPRPPPGHFWSTHSYWFQHMPALPKLLLKTSNIHNFWSVVPKIMKFAFTQSLFRDAFGKNNSKILKIMWVETTLPKTGLAPVGLVRPLGVKD